MITVIMMEIRVIEDETSGSLIIVLFYTQSADCKNSGATLVVTKQVFKSYRCNNFNILDNRI